MKANRAFFERAPADRRLALAVKRTDLPAPDQHIVGQCQRDER
jgi:hypothetical protein